MPKLGLSVSGVNVGLLCNEGFFPRVMIPSGRVGPPFSLCMSERTSSAVAQLSSLRATRGTLRRPREITDSRNSQLQCWVVLRRFSLLVPLGYCSPLAHSARCAGHVKSQFAQYTALFFYVLKGEIPPAVKDADLGLQDCYASMTSVCALSHRLLPKA